MLTVAGDQVPINPFWELVDKFGAVLPRQISGRAVNAGVVLVVIVCVSVVINAHWFASGVKV